MESIAQAEYSFKKGNSREPKCLSLLLLIFPTANLISALGSYISTSPSMCPKLCLLSIFLFASHLFVPFSAFTITINYPRHFAS